MNLPHYEKAPITGKNLHALVGSYFRDYRPTEPQYFEKFGRELVEHLSKYIEYKDYNMDTIEGFCVKAQSCISKTSKPGELTYFSQLFILEIIIMAFIKTRTGLGYANQINESKKLIQCLKNS